MSSWQQSMGQPQLSSILRRSVTFSRKAVLERESKDSRGEAITYDARILSTTYTVVSKKEVEHRKWSNSLTLFHNALPLKQLPDSLALIQ